MLKRILRYCSLVLGSFFLSVQPLLAAEEVPQDFIDELVQQHGFQASWIRQQFKQVNIKQSILKAMSRPGEAKPYYEYQAIFLTPTRLTQGQAFFRQQRNLLQRAEQQTGVSASVIAAIIGVETGYGQNMGSFRVIDALSTLAFHYPKRAEFFRKELIEFFLLCREQGWSPLIPKGSYAGAMGMGQFIPSSYRQWAVDFDGDGKINLWDVNDAVGSVANYLAVHQWQAGGGVVIPVRYLADDTPVEALLEQGGKPSNSWSHLHNLGVQLAVNLPAATPAALISLKGPDEQPLYWLSLQNFYVITRYNHSWRYAMAVYNLSKALEASLYAP